MPKTPKILLVEDEVITAIMMTAQLKNAGFSVSHRVPSGEEAVSLIVGESFDVVLMDIRLAGKIDGLEAARRINEIRKTPVIFTSGYQDEEIRKKAQALSPLAYLVKPVNEDQLVAILRELNP